MAGNLLGESFKLYVNAQIKDRQEIYGKKQNRTLPELKYLNARNAWIKMASGVWLEQDRINLLKKYNNPLLNGINVGGELALKNVLFNGLSSYGDISDDLADELETNFNRNYKPSYSRLIQREALKGNKQRSGILGSNRAYGVGGSQEYGYSPMPGITDVSIKDLNRGSIKKATINIKAHNRNQFDVIDVLYMRLGYSIMIEWGNDKYIDKVENSKAIIEDMGLTLIDGKFFKFIRSSYNKILPEIAKLREVYKGNYDGFFGVISNFSWTFNDDGSYSIKLEAISHGDVIESLKANVPTHKEKNSTSGGNTYSQTAINNLGGTNAVSEDDFYNVLYSGGPAPNGVGLKEIIENFYDAYINGIPINDRANSGLVVKGISNIQQFERNGFGFSFPGNGFTDPPYPQFKNEDYTSSPEMDTLTSGKNKKIIKDDDDLVGISRSFLRGRISKAFNESIKTIVAQKIDNAIQPGNTTIINGEEFVDWQKVSPISFKGVQNTSFDMTIRPTSTFVMSGRNTILAQYSYFAQELNNYIAAIDGSTVAFNNSGYDRKFARRMGGVSKSDFRATLIDPTHQLPPVNGVSPNNLVAEKLNEMFPNKPGKYSADAKYCADNNMDTDQILRRLLFVNIPITTFKSKLYEGFAEIQLAGSEVDPQITSNRGFFGQAIAAPEPTPQEEADKEAELKKSKNKIFNYFYTIRKIWNNSDPNSTTLPEPNRNITIINSSEIIGKTISPSTQPEIDLWKTAVGFPSYTNPTQATQEKDFLRMNWTDLTKQYYIRLGTFLQYMQDIVIPKVETSRRGDPMLNINYSVEDNICYVIDNMVSLDHSKIIIRNDAVYNGTSFEPYFQEINQFITPSPNGKELYGKLMNVYLSFARIEELFGDVDKNNQISVFEILKNICGDINESLGAVNNIEPVVDKETNTVTLIDQTPIPGIEDIASGIPGYANRFLPSLNEATLEVFGYNNKDQTSNFVRKAGITTEITKEYATMITIGATANGALPGAESTAFSKWNIGIKDRFKNNIIDGEARASSTIEDQNEQVLKNYKAFCERKYGKLGLEKESGRFTLNPDLADKNKDVVGNYYIYAQAESSNVPNEPIESSIGFLPFNLKLEMDGLSGIKIYNKVKVNTSFLPSNYGDTLSFIITGVNHELKGNEWVTKLTTIATVKN